MNKLLVAVSLVALIFPCAAFAEGVRCSSGAFQHDCPNDAPVCCFNGDGYPAGCCAEFMECDDRGGCKPGPDLPMNETGVPLHDVSEDVHMTIRRLIQFVSIMVSVLLATFLLVFGLMWLKRLRSEREARRALLGAENEEAEEVQDDEVTSDDEARFHLELRQRGPAVQIADDKRVLQCAKCGASDVNCMFLECEHCVTCHTCAQRLKRCPECHAIIKKRKRLFMA